MLITKQIEIDMGHRVTNHKSKCKSLHGHRYSIVVGIDDKVVTTEGVSDEGMVIDFSDVKQIMMNEIDAKFDHGFILYDRDPFKVYFEQMLGEQPEIKVIFVSFVPTAENLAKYWFRLLKNKLDEKQIAIKYVEVYETPTSTARYTVENSDKELAVRV